MLRISENEELFKSVAKILARNERQYNKYIESGQIEDSELRKVKKIKLNCKSLNGIEKLTSLTSLDISYSPDDNVESYAETIGKLTNLTNLRIIGDYDMDIDLKHNTKLKDILIFGENCKVKGVQELECLNNGKRKLSLYLSGNTTLDNMEQLVSKATKKNTKRMVLPHLLFAKEKSENPNIVQALNATSANILFQTHGVNEYMTIAQTMEIDKEIEKIKEQLQLSQRDNEGKIIKTYEYMCENYTYAYDEASKESTAPTIRKDKIRSFSKVLTKKRGVCAAFSNIFNYILQSEGITCLPVHSGAGKAHQLSKVRNSNDEWSYYDPTFGIGFNGNVDWRFFHMSKERVNLYCILNDREKHYKSDKDIAWPVLKEKIELESLPMLQRNIKNFIRNEEEIEENKANVIPVKIKDTFEKEK